MSTLHTPTASSLPTGIAYHIGVDGGPEATRVRLYKADGKVLGEGQAGASALTQGVNQAWENIQLAIFRAVHASGLLEQPTSPGALPPHTSNCALDLSLVGANDHTLRQQFLAANPGHTYLHWGAYPPSEGMPCQ